MGYRSDIRIRLRKEDYKNLVEKFEEERDKHKANVLVLQSLLEQATTDEEKTKIRNDIYKEDCMCDLFDKDNKSDWKELAIYREEETTIYEGYDKETEKYNSHEEDTVYFGWNGLKWYRGYADVDFIMDYIQNLDYYAYARIGEEMGDIEQLENGFDTICVYAGFDED